MTNALTLEQRLMELSKGIILLRDALKDVLPLAERYLEKAPTDPDNTKLEDARAALRRARDLVGPHQRTDGSAEVTEEK